MIQILRKPVNFVLCVALLVPLMLPAFVQAETVVRAGDEISVNAEQRVDGDFYVTARTTVMSGSVVGDMYAIGDTVTINGPVGADVAAVSRTFGLHASTADDVRIVAGEAVIADDIGGDLFLIGGTVDILSTATISGNVYLFAVDVTIDAPIAGSVYGTVERLRVDSSVGGNIDVRAPAGLVLGDEAVVGGDVTFASRVPIVRDPQSQVEGTVSEKSIPAASPNEVARAVLLPLFIVLFGVLSLYLLARPAVVRFVNVAVEQPLQHVLIGAGVVLLAPMVMVLLFATVLGSALAAGLLALQIIGYVLAILLAGAVAGWFVQVTYFQGQTINLLTIFLGTVGLYFVVLIPILGLILGVGMMLIVIGAATRLLAKAVMG